MLTHPNTRAAAGFDPDLAVAVATFLVKRGMPVVGIVAMPDDMPAVPVDAYTAMDVAEQAMLHLVYAMG